MLVKILIAVLLCSLLCPSVSHALGLLRYAFDAIASQPVIDRGSIPKTVPRTPPGALNPHGPLLNKGLDGQKVYIRAEGV